MQFLQYLGVFITIVLLNGCKLDPKKVATPPQTSLNQAPDTSTILINSAKALISFEKNEYDFGLAITGDTIKHAFSFKNAGTDTLFVYKVSTSCDCLRAHSNKDYFLPEESGFIDLQYTTADKSGPQDREIYLTCNTLPALTTLKLKGYIKN